jgi:hypothetical protein
MVALIDISGRRFGRLKVLKRAHPAKNGGSPVAMWLCRCDCGTKTIVRGSSLRNGRTVSCGCYGRQTGLVNTTHGHLKHYRSTPEYNAWRTMLAHCYSPANDKYRWYGAKGIAVCDRWRTKFATFLADMGPKPAPHMILSRLDKEGDYEPQNCEWAERLKIVKTRHRRKNDHPRKPSPKKAARAKHGKRARPR